MTESAELQAQIRATLKKMYGPSIENAELLNIFDEPSSSYIREQLRNRGLTHADLELIKTAPREKRFVFKFRKSLKDSGISINHEIVVIADSSGNILDVIESG